MHQSAVDVVLQCWQSNAWRRPPAWGKGIHGRLRERELVSSYTTSTHSRRDIFPFLEHTTLETMVLQSCSRGFHMLSR